MITNDDLLKEISSQELTQLSDLNATGSLDQSVIDDAISDALGFVGSWIDIPDSPSPFLKELVVELTIDTLRKRNRLGDDETRTKRRDQIIGYLKRMRTRSMPSAASDTLPRSHGGAFRHGRTRAVGTRGYR